MNEWPKEHGSSPENVPDELSGFVDKLSQALQMEASFDNVDGTYEIEAEDFSLSFTLEHPVFEIRNIETRAPGLGRKIIEVIHDFADEEGFQVQASNVRDEARGFWQKMGYQEGTHPDEYFRP